MNSWGTQPAPQPTWARGPLLQTPRSPPQAPPGPRRRPRPALTIICATSSALRENWKEPACALPRMAWQTMHRLWTKHNFRPGSCRDSGLREAQPGIGGLPAATEAPPQAALPSTARNTVPSVLRGSHRPSSPRQSQGPKGWGAETVPRATGLSAGSRPGGPCLPCTPHCGWEGPQSRSTPIESPSRTGLLPLTDPAWPLGLGKGRATVVLEHGRRPLPDSNGPGKRQLSERRQPLPAPGDQRVCS